MIVGVHPADSLLQGLAEAAEPLEVRRAERQGIDAQVVVEPLEVAEPRGAVERELLFLGGQGVEERAPRDAGAAGAAAPSSRSSSLVEAVGEDDHQPAPADPLGQGVQDAAERRLAAGLRLFERLAEDREVARRRPGRDHRAHGRVERDQPDRVALADHQVGQRRRQPPRVLELRDGLARVAHAARRVDDEIGLKVRLFFIFLDVIAVGLAEGPPVDMADLVAGPVLAMLGELDREPLERALVQARHHPFDHQAARSAPAGRSGPGRWGRERARVGRSRQAACILKSLDPYCRP